MTKWKVRTDSMMPEDARHTFARGQSGHIFYATLSQPGDHFVDAFPTNPAALLVNVYSDVVNAHPGVLV